MPLVSFVVPCYKHGHFLADCIGSILGQTFQDFEVLIMDDCSPDETPVIARSFTDPRVFHIRNERNLGHIPNYNKGISLARGKYVWLINVDDYLRQPYVLEKFVAVMEKAPTVAYVFCRAFSVRGGIETPLEAMNGTVDRTFTGREFLKRLVIRNSVVTPSVMVRRTSFDRVGLYEADLPHAGDWFQWCRHAFYGDVAYLDEPMVCYRLHDSNMSSWFDEHAEKLIADEVEVRWRVKAMAERLGFADVAAAAVDAIARDYSVRVALRLTQGWNRGMTLEEVKASVRAHTQDAALMTRFIATVLQSVGDEYYKNGDVRRAGHYYRRAWRENPRQLVTLAKCAFTALGPAGRTLREAAARFRQQAGAQA